MKYGGGLSRHTSRARDRRASETVTGISSSLGPWQPPFSRFQMPLPYCRQVGVGSERPEPAPCPETGVMCRYQPSQRRAPVAGPFILGLHLMDIVKAGIVVDVYFPGSVVHLEDAAL